MQSSGNVHMHNSWICAHTKFRDLCTCTLSTVLHAAFEVIVKWAVEAARFTTYDQLSCILEMAYNMFETLLWHRPGSSMNIWLKIIMYVLPTSKISQAAEVSNHLPNQDRWTLHHRPDRTSADSSRNGRTPPRSSSPWCLPCIGMCRIGLWNVYTCQTLQRII